MLNSLWNLLLLRKSPQTKFRNKYIKDIKNIQIHKNQSYFFLQLPWIHWFSVPASIYFVARSKMERNIFFNGLLVFSAKAFAELFLFSYVWMPLLNSHINCVSPASVYFPFCFWDTYPILFVLVWITLKLVFNMVESVTHLFSFYFKIYWPILFLTFVLLRARNCCYILPL